MPRFAANLTMMFNEVDFLDRFEAAAAAGFTAVEFLFPYDHPAAEIRRRAEAAGVEIVLFNMPPGDWIAGERGMAVFPERAAEFTTSLNTALDYAETLSVPRLHMMAGIARADDPEARKRYRESLAEAAKAAARHDIDVLIEPLNKRDMPGYFLNDFALAAEIIADLDQPNIKLQFDIYHRQILHGDVITALQTYAPIIGHIQTASVPHRHEPGTGELDDGRIFTEVEAIRYAGHIGCEYRPLTSTNAGLSWRNPHLPAASAVRQ
jgi:hydroxypyruvate isomerase